MRWPITRQIKQEHVEKLVHISIVKKIEILKSKMAAAAILDLLKCSITSAGLSFWAEIWTAYTWS